MKYIFAGSYKWSKGSMNRGLFQLPYVLMMLSIISFSDIATAISVEDFSRHSEYYDVKISPDGKHLAVLVDTDGRKTLAFLDSNTFKMTFAFKGGKRDQVGDYYWVNNERVVAQIVQ
ncbi:MAG: hypothetical protein V5788_00845, partial [Shewanella sp.]